MAHVIVTCAVWLPGMNGCDAAAASETATVLTPKSDKSAVCASPEPVRAASVFVPVIVAVWLNVVAGDEAGEVAQLVGRVTVNVLAAVLVAMIVAGTPWTKTSYRPREEACHRCPPSGSSLAKRSR